MREFLARENAGLAQAQWPVSCGLFAPNAPEQNPTEELWLKGKNYLRKQFAVNKTFAQVRQCFLDFLQGVRFESTKLGWYWDNPQMN